MMHASEASRIRRSTRSVLRTGCICDTPPLKGCCRVTSVPCREPVEIMSDLVVQVPNKEPRLPARNLEIGALETQ